MVHDIWIEDILSDHVFELINPPCGFSFPDWDYQDSILSFVVDDPNRKLFIPISIYVKICYKGVHVLLPCQNRIILHTPPVKVKASRYN